MSASANVTQFLADSAEITPVIVNTIGIVLNLLLQPPLVIFVGVMFVYAGVRIGMSIWNRLRK
jgi:predicted Co/Zn/Cd cation transporter (cation efflux family)